MTKIPIHVPSTKHKPKIDYPCTWQYKIIGESAAAIRHLVKEHVFEQDYLLSTSNVSRGGRYVSMSLELTVQSEERRLALYRVLAQDPTVKVVL